MRRRHRRREVAVPREADRGLVVERVAASQATRKETTRAALFILQVLWPLALTVAVKSAEASLLTTRRYGRGRCCLSRLADPR